VVDCCVLLTHLPLFFFGGPQFVLLLAGSPSGFECAKTKPVVVQSAICHESHLLAI
jgi:uncharacterized protein